MITPITNLWNQLTICGINRILSLRNERQCPNLSDFADLDLITQIDQSAKSVLEICGISGLD